MSPQRVADAAHIAPYPTHIGHHANSSDNGRMRGPTKGRKARSRAVPERSEEDRFNISSRQPTLAAGRGTRRRVPRPDRTRDDDYNDGNNEAIPNYPPPSFLEAMSTPALSLCASTTTLVAPSTSPIPSLPAPGTQHQMQNAQSHSSVISSDSDDSLEMIEADPLQTDDRLTGRLLEERVREDWINRRGVEFPTPPHPKHSPPQDRDKNAHEGKRGRVGTRSRGASDSEAEDTEPEVRSEPPKTPTDAAKRRYLSLSPLRTLFPSRPLSPQDRALSAHPSPNSSPYSFPRSSPSIFRSTTSLRMPTASHFKGPSTPTSSAASSFGHEHFMPRMLLHSRGKERGKAASSDTESLDVWEVVDSSTIPKLDSIDSSDPFLATSSTRSQSFTYGSPPSSVIGTTGEPTEDTQSISPSGQPQSNTSIHPLSLRDRKVPPIPIIPRKPRRRAPPVPPLRSDPVTPTGQQANSPPPLISVRTRNGSPHSPPLERKPQTVGTSPLGADSWRAEDVHSATILQKALETPLPPTPVDRTFFSHEPKKQIFLNTNSGLTRAHSTMPQTPPSTPSAYGPRSPITPIARSATTCANTTKSSIATKGDLTQTCHALEHLSFGSHVSSDTAYLSSADDTSRRHYPGRPLPRPPVSIRTMVDSTYASNDDFTSQRGSRMANWFPDGLLIDLDDTSLSSNSTSGASTPLFEGRLQDLSQIHIPMTPATPVSPVSPVSPATSFVTDSSVTPTSTSSYFEALSEPASSSASTSSTVSNPVRFSEFTDLDVLVARLQDEHRNGADYDTLLLVSEFLEPAVPPLIPHSPVSSTHSIPKPITNANISLAGRIKVARRRTTKDGRVKLKLSLLDSSVDRCGICLSQFRDGESAGLSAVCRHAFHERCLGRWIARSRTCPMCRVPLDLAA